MAFTPLRKASPNFRHSLQDRGKRTFSASWMHDMRGRVLQFYASEVIRLIGMPISIWPRLRKTLNLATRNFNTDIQSRDRLIYRGYVRLNRNIGIGLYLLTCPIMSLLLQLLQVIGSSIPLEDYKSSLFDENGENLISDACRTWGTSF